MKKFLAVLLALVMVLSLFAGCSTKSSKKKKSSSSRKDDDDDNKKKETTSETGSTDGTGSTDSTKGNNNKVDKESGKNPTEAPSGSLVPIPTTPVDQPNGGTVRPYPGGNNNGGTTTNSGVAAGTLLDQPEKIFDTDNMDALYIAITMEEDGESMSFRFTYVKTDSTIFVYAVNGPGDAEEAVYETTTSGVTKYAKVGSAFQKDTSTDPDDIQDELDSMYDVVDMFVACQEEFSDIQYRKVGTQNAATGPVYVYDVVYEGEVDGQIWIDQATGMMVKLVGYTGNFTYQATAFDLNAVKMPSYK